MPHYLITYDNKPPRNYTALYRLMAEWKAVKLAESVWLVNLQGPAPAIRAIVLGKMQRNDLVAVVELKHGADWAVSTTIPITARTWLPNYVRPSQAAA